MICRCGVAAQACVLAALALGAAALHQSASPALSTEVGGRGIDLPAHAGAPNTVTPAPIAVNTTIAAPAPPISSVPAQIDPTPTSAPAPEAGGAKMLTTPQAQSLFESRSAQFIDAREPVEFLAGHMPGATNLPVSAFSGDQLAATDPRINQRLARMANVVVYCGGGACDASKLVAKQLELRGFTKVAIYHDGWTGWSAARLAAETGAEREMMGGMLMSLPEAPR
ncbi:hypothetical protein BH11PLA1_BH11PLA1_08140 [soil metagenome]